MPKLVDPTINIKLKLSLLWASTMFCYIYCDYFELYVPGKVEGMISGVWGSFGTVSQGLLLGISSILLIPSLMVFLSVGLPARYSRVLNLIFGVVFTLMMALLTYVAGWYFYKLYAAIETLLTMLVIWYAWNWPKETEAI